MKDIVLTGNSLARKAFDFFLFTSIYIACCSVAMIYQTWYLFGITADLPFVLFVFFGSLCSYNFHMYLTPGIYGGSYKTMWSIRHKMVHLVLLVVGMAGAAYYVWHLLPYWRWLIATAFVTFLYSAPKVPLKPLQHLKHIAVGKTIYLALVWTHSTVILPLVVTDTHWTWAHFLFVINRFFLIYPICIVFDYRDREEDKKEGIRSLVTSLSVKGIDRLFWGCLLVFAWSTLGLYQQGFSIADCTALFIPGLIMAFLYSYSKRTPSDYLYLFILDGLMMFSSILLFLFHF